jgi:hypothetical protein
MVRGAGAVYCVAEKFVGRNVTSLTSQSVSTAVGEPIAESGTANSTMV